MLGFEVGDGGDDAFWTAFLRSLNPPRAWPGCKLVISDTHGGLKAAFVGALLGATWNGRRVHSLRNVTATAPKCHTGMVAIAVRAILDQLSPDHRRGSALSTEPAAPLCRTLLPAIL